MEGPSKGPSKGPFKDGSKVAPIDNSITVSNASSVKSNVSITSNALQVLPSGTVAVHNSLVRSLKPLKRSFRFSYFAIAVLQVTNLVYFAF